jgi:hypothetical protein
MFDGYVEFGEIDCAHGLFDEILMRVAISSGIILVGGAEMIGMEKCSHGLIRFSLLRKSR